MSAFFECEYTGCTKDGLQLNLYGKPHILCQKHYRRWEYLKQHEEHRSAVQTEIDIRAIAIARLHSDLTYNEVVQLTADVNKASARMLSLDNKSRDLVRRFLDGGFEDTNQ